MSDKADQEFQPSIELDASDSRLDLTRRCEAASIEHAWSLLPGSGIASLRVGFPNGRDKRWQTVSRSQAADLQSVDVGNLTFLGDLDAVLFKSTGVIEAAVREFPASSRQYLKHLPTVTRITDPQPTLFDGDDIEPDETSPEIRGSGIGPDDAWVLKFEPGSEGSLKIEIGSSSREFSALSYLGRRRYATARNRPPLPHGLGRFTTIRISGIQTSRHDEALEILNRVSDAVFFELDLLYDVAPRLAESMAAERSRMAIYESPANTNFQPPRNPHNHYPEKPLSLYWYGRSASGMPLLEYLAYYQVLEYFFPSFSHRDTLEKLRAELMDPRFRVHDDSDLVRIIGLASGAGKGFGSERDQLRSTIAGSVPEGRIREFIKSDQLLASNFSGKEKVKGVAIINLADGRNDLLSAVSNRIYDIRCRIVHAKEDGGGSSVDLLLPYSAEANSLGPDISLVKFIAQKVLIAGSGRLRV